MRNVTLILFSLLLLISNITFSNNCSTADTILVKQNYEPDTLSISGSEHWIVFFADDTTTFLKYKL